MMIYFSGLALITAGFTNKSWALGIAGIYLCMHFIFKGPPK